MPPPLSRRRAAARLRYSGNGWPPPPDAILASRRWSTFFLSASRSENFEVLLAVLHTNVVLRADAAAVHPGASPEERGAAALADTFSARARAARRAVVGGAVRLVWAVGKSSAYRLRPRWRDGRIVAILIANPDR